LPGAGGGDVGGIEGREVGQVPPGTVEVETIPDHERVGNVETDEIRLDGDFRPPGLPQEDE
jgi:hypothetical protein